VDLGANEIIQTYHLNRRPQAVAVNGLTNAAAVIEDKDGDVTLIPLRYADSQPQVSITSPADNAIVNTSPTIISGTVKNAVGVTVNDVPAMINGDNFSATISLTAGTNTLTAVATDETGRTVSHRITVIHIPVMKGTIDGTVVNAITGVPIPGATIAVTDAQGVTKTETSRVDGGFTMTDVAIGDFTGSAMKLGYATYGFAGLSASGQTTVITARLEPIPPVITGINVTDITDDSARISWVSDQPTDGLLKYGETAAYGGARADGTLTSSHSLVLTGLSASQTYHFRVTSTSANGASVMSADQTFKTKNRIDMTITAPADGTTVMGQSVMVTGIAGNSSNGETGLTVDGIAANLMGGQFAVSHVPLSPGANTITVTATDIDGTTATKSFTVMAAATEHNIRLTAYPDSGVAPLEVTVRINGSFSIANPSVASHGPNPVELLPTGNPDEYKYRINTEGVYHFTAQAMGPDGNAYQDSVSVTVLPLGQIDNLLRAKWAAFTDAMQQKNTTAALKFMLTYSRGRYQVMFDILNDQLPNIVSTYGDLVLDSIEGDRAWYELKARQDGGLFSYRVGFMKDADGLWRLREF
jgi:hypothetical protein